MDSTDAKVATHEVLSQHSMSYSHEVEDVAFMSADHGSFAGLRVLYLKWTFVFETC
jgi:hypothetical protein